MMTPHVAFRVTAFGVKSVESMVHLGYFDSFVQDTASRAYGFHVRHYMGRIRSDPDNRHHSGYQCLTASVLFRHCFSYGFPLRFRLSSRSDAAFGDVLHHGHVCAFSLRYGVGDWTRVALTDMYCWA